MPPAVRHRGDRGPNIRICAAGSSNSLVEQNVESSRIPTYTMRTPRFLEICINTGAFTSVVGEVDITHAESDSEMFKKVAKTYYDKRGKDGLTTLHLPRCFARIIHKSVLQWRFQRPAQVVYRRVGRSDPLSAKVQ